MRSMLVRFLILIASPALAQAPVSAYVPTLTFDVASVRESPPADSYMVSFFSPANSSLTRLMNNSVGNLLSSAYGVQFYQIAGIPDSLNRAMFNIEARADADTDAKLEALSAEDVGLEKQHMMQVLLADRFHLKVHWETREGPDYELVVMKRGPKFSETKGAPPSAEEVKKFGDKPVPEYYQLGSSRTGFEYMARGVPIEDLVQTLAGNFGCPVVDKTGLTRRYDFAFHYHGTHASEINDNDPTQWPPLETAIEDQLGLKLESSKGPVRTLVIDHMEKPTAN